MSAIAEAFRPDMTRYAEGEYSENEFYQLQYCHGRPLLEGAAGILEKNEGDCDACMSANDLLKAFQAMMEAAQEGVRKTKHAPRREVSPDEIREMIAEGNLMVCIYSANREPVKEWFIIAKKEEGAA